MNQTLKVFESGNQATVVIVGRPNVGKSTLFNRIIGHRDAIVDDQPGVTRDSKYRQTDWNGKGFTLVDTGGFFGPEEDPFSKVVQDRIELTARDAAVLLLIVDAKIGPTPADHDVIQLLRRLKRPILIAVNKVDVPQHEEESMAPFYELGIGEMHPVSATHGTGIGDLLDAIVEYVPDEAPVEGLPDRPGIAIIGRPNVGKSTLLNSLCGADRAIVSPVSGTTRDPVDSEITVNDKPYLLIDTAGIRRRGKMSQGLERFTLIRAQEAIRRCHIALLMIDSTEGLTETDDKVFANAKDAGKAAIIIVNKWDVVEKDEKTAGLYAKDIRDRIPFLHYAPIEFVSALTKQRVHRIFPHVEEILDFYNRRVPTAKLNQLLETILIRHPAPPHKGRVPYIFYWTQAGVAPPTFVAFTNDPEAIHFSYERYLINRLYDTFEFKGTPLRLIWKKRSGRPIE